MKTHTIIMYLLITVLPLFATGQCIDGDCIDGYGIYVLPGGSTYEGSFLNGEMHGMGSCAFYDGTRYDGSWHKRYPEGYGVMVLNNGDTREGYWLKGQPALENRGELLLIDSLQEFTCCIDIQFGCILGDCKDGEGILAYIDGSKYEGSFADGKINGWGTWYFPNGDKYIGSFHENLFHGKGALYRVDGSRLEGHWKHGEFEGITYDLISKEGCSSGDCENGQGVYIFANSSATYTGSFKNNLPNGYGVCVYNNGEKYVGLWRSGSFEGEGTLTLNNGTRVSGMWKEGTYLGPVNPQNHESRTVVVDSNKRTTNTEEIPVSTEGDNSSSQLKESFKIWAVVIGVSTYQHMPVLKYADDDAYRVYAFYKSPEGGSLPEEQIKLLVDEDASIENIKETLVTTFAKAGEDDLVILYFSGHGLENCLLPIDFDGQKNKLFHKELNEIFHISPSKYKLCIVDACHSGNLFASKGDIIPTTNKTLFKWFESNPGTAIIMSSKAEENSLESKGLRQGVFSHFLLRALNGEGDTDGNGMITVTELYDFVYMNVRAYTNNHQSPVLRGDFDEKMPVSKYRE